MSRIQRVIAAERTRLATRETLAVDRLHRAHQTIIDTLHSDLEGVTDLIEDAVREGRPVNIDWLRRQERYHRLIEQTQARYAQYEPLVTDTVTGAKRDAVWRAQSDAVERAEALGLRTNVMYATLNVPALEALSGALSPDSPLRGIIRSHGPRAVEIIERELIAGMGRGSGADEMVRSIRRQLGGDADVARLRALIRSESMRSYRASLFEQYSGMGFRYWRWSCALSARSCLACISQGGKVFSMDDPFMPAHVNCRCSPAPATSDTPLRGMDGEAWFARQPADVQRRMIGNQDAYAAYRDGQLQLKDFTGHQHSDVWGSAIYQRSGRSALQAKGIA
jgi:SPP1 gp7 family putative phage head morphogenesis protein